MNNFIAYGCFFTSFFYVYNIIVHLNKKNALALKEMSKTAETEIPTFFFWLWPAAADMGTVRKK